MTAKPSGGLTIGALAARTGLAVSAIRFYETHGIIAPLRNAGGHRRYGRSDIRRLSFVMIAQTMGYGLGEIAALLRDLPADRAPSRGDWDEVARAFRDRIDRRMAALRHLRDRLDGCIGCGCLSLDTCALHNADDGAARGGSGPRLLREAVAAGGVDSAAPAVSGSGHETLASHLEPHRRRP